jgi:hypothetical protein
MARATTQTCPICGVKFVDSKHPDKRYCSRRCRGVATTRPLAERFWEKVNKDGPVIRPELGPCWLWTGAVNDKGYGEFWLDGGSESAHRVSYELANGPLREGGQSLHRCDNPPCVRPDHLFEGTNLDNVHDRQAKGRPCGVRGEHHHQAKLTEDNVREIRRRLAQGHYQTDIASDYGVGQYAIWAISCGKTWSHVKDVPVEVLS